MNVLDIRTSDRRSEFRPGEILEGRIEWVLDRSVEALELRLIWFTSGKGDTDVSIEESRRFEAPSLSDNAAFRFTLPEAPHSFSGKLISLSWALELVVIPGEDAARFEFSLSPTGRELILPQSDEVGVASKQKVPLWLESKVQRKAPSSQSALEQRSPFDN